MATIIVEDGTLVLGANSYVTVSYADDYFENHPFYSLTWEEIDPTQKESLLIYATALIDRSFEFYGSLSSYDQSLSWPRVGVCDLNGRILLRNAIPTALKSAVCEMALEASRGDIFAESSSAGLEELRIDVIQLKFDKSQTSSTVPKAALMLLNGLGNYRFRRKVGRVEVG